jgi:hypothetical protein
VQVSDATVAGKDRLEQAALFTKIASNKELADGDPKCVASHRVVSCLLVLVSMWTSMSL